MQSIEIEIRQRATTFMISLATPLVFANQPAQGSPYPPERPLDLEPNSGTFRLSQNDRVNFAFLEQENRLRELLGGAHLLPPCARKDELEETIFQELERCNTIKRDHWNHQRMHVDKNQVVVRNEINFVSVSRWEPAVLVSMVVTAMMTCIFNVPRQGGSALLAGLQDLARIYNQKADLPRDPRTVFRHLHLDPVTEAYICCPSCWALTLYRTVDNPVTEANPNPQIPLCQERLTVGSPICGEELWKKETIKGEVKCTPRMKYIHQHLKDWLGRLLSRPGIEDILDDYPTAASRLTQEGKMSDIWSSPEIIGLKGSDGKLFFGPDRPKGEARYLFSFAVDGFNPFQNKTAKQKVTSTGFWAILLNFPPNFRHLFENMCLLGAGPGPFAPTVGRLNPFLDLMVRDFIELWHGVHFTKTAKYDTGRDGKAMFIPLTADMLGAREAGGFTSATSKYFCISCHLDMAHVEEIWDEWPQRSHADHLAEANAWKDAETVQEQKKLASKTGIRFSPLLTIPYWMAVRYILVEPMHALALIIINHHVRKYFRIDLSADGGDGSEPRVSRPSRPSDDRMTRVLKLFCEDRTISDSGLLKKLLANEWASFAALWHICNDRQLRIAGTKRSWFILRIKRWIDQTDPTDDEILTIPIPSPTAGEALAKLVEKAVGSISPPPGPYKVTEIELQDCIKLLRALYRGTKFSSLSSYKVNMLVNLCALRKIPGNWAQWRKDTDGKGGRPTRQAMYDLLMVRILEEKSQLPVQDQVNRGPVLGRDVMGAIWAEMTHTIIPSWMGVAPRNWGTAARGKMSAAHWHAIFTVHMPITLIWLWRNETGRKRELLDNMIEGVVAIIAANFKTTDLETADYYDKHYREYVKGALRLFREDTIPPTIHCAFHIGDNLRHFGPGHSRSAQHYERYIHHLQRQNTNGKFGEMESTFMQSTSRIANLKALLQDNVELRTQVAGTVKALKSTPPLMDPHLHVPSKWGVLSVSEQSLLHAYLSHKFGPFRLENWRASGNIMDAISVGGVEYARKNLRKNDRDSHIIFQLPGTDGPVPGQILNIFQHWHTTPAGVETEDIYLIVDQFDHRPNVPDPYRRLPAMMGYLAGATPVQTCIIESTHIHSHFVMTPRKLGNVDLMHVFPASGTQNEFLGWDDGFTADDDEPDSDHADEEDPANVQTQNRQQRWNEGYFDDDGNLENYREDEYDDQDWVMDED